MKALILAAGLGTRLKPLTDTIPKVLVPINGIPLLDYHLESLRRSNITDVLINTHYLSDIVQDYCDLYNEKNNGLTITVTYEKSLLGSAGTMIANRAYFANDKNLLIIYGDDFTNLNYRELISFHEMRNSLATIVCNKVENIQEKGMIVFDENDEIKHFKEKPSKDEVISNYSNCGIYVIKTELIEKISPLSDQQVTLDFGHDVFPYLLKKNEKMSVFKISDFLIDIGTIEQYKIAQEIASNNHDQRK